jgi:hypothetical protein
MPSQHGLRPLREAVKGLGGRVIDKRTSLGKTLAKWRADLIDDPGGADSISTPQSALIDLCVSKLILDSIDACLLTQPSLINKQKKTLLPAVRERQALADGLAHYLNQLGLERRHKVKTLSDILSEDDEREPAHTNGKATTEPDP